jgi:uncharacterized membrane protein YgdD (TMEM256/DUF423 family)
MERFCLIFASLNGFLAVAFGAFGAHGLKRKLEAMALAPDETAKILGWVDTGARYQLVHAAALLALAALWPRLNPGPATLAARGFAWGALIFSLSLYAMALGAPRWFGAITPIGGLGLLVGWASLGWAFSH